ncbi:MAG: AAA family ATPase [Verrucomicrobiae bacterium]|nr:AAA family ATPase [Verrucomicrobiae bacterium]
MTEKTIILPPGANGNGADAQYRLTMMVPKRRYLSYLRERWWVVLLSLAISISSIVVYETVRTQKYISVAQIYMSGNVQLNVGSLFSEESLTYFGTQIELLKSARLQNAAFQKAGITIPPGHKNPYNIEVVQPLKTSILQLQATGPDLELTQLVLQSLVNEYLAYKKETRMTTSQDVLDSLQDGLTKKAADLQTEQENWAGFQRSNNLAVLLEESKSDGLYLSELNLNLAKLELDADLLAAGLPPLSTVTVASPTNSANSPTNGTPATDSLGTKLATDLEGTDKPTSSENMLVSAKVELAVLRAQQNQALAEHGESAAHRMNDAITNLQQRVEVLEQQNWQQQQASLDQIRKRIAAMEASIPGLEKKVLALDELLAKGDQLKNNVTREQNYYDHMLGTLQNVDLGKNLQQEVLSVLQPATAAQLEKRHLPLRIALAGFGGLCFGLGIVFVWYLLDDRFVSFHDIKDQFGETFLGLVPQIKVPKTKPQTALLNSNDPRPGYMESYRHLRSALLLSSIGEGRPQTLLFTSASPAEGKTTIAVNLARLLARSGLRVVLVDADGQGGGMSRLLGDKEQPGLLDYLRGEASAETIVHPTEFESLLLVPGGTHQNPSEGLFLRPKLAELIQELRKNADFVVLDGAPILASDAAALLVPYADSVILVTRPFYTRSRLVRQTLDMLYQRQAKHVSIILNRARPDDLAGHYAMHGMSRTHRNGTAARA